MKEQFAPIGIYPITSTDNEHGGQTHAIYIYDVIRAPNFFHEIIDILDTATSQDLVIFKLNTPGGDADSAIMLLDAIRNSDAQCLADASGLVASAGTAIALACDGLRCAKHTEFMFHNYSSEVVGKGHELWAAISFKRRNLKKFMSDVYKKFLTKTELKTMINHGADYYFDAEEVMRRWERVVEYRTATLRKAQEEQRKEELSAMAQTLSENGFKVTYTGGE